MARGQAQCLWVGGGVDRALMTDVLLRELGGVFGATCNIGQGALLLPTL